MDRRLATLVALCSSPVRTAVAARTRIVLFCGPRSLQRISNGSSLCPGRRWADLVRRVRAYGPRTDGLTGLLKLLYVVEVADVVRCIQRAHTYTTSIQHSAFRSVAESACSVTTRTRGFGCGTQEIYTRWAAVVCWPRCACRCAGRCADWLDY